MNTVKGPTDWEYRLIARCLIESDVLYGTHREIWTHTSAWRALATWRECIDTITMLIGDSHGVQASFIKACVMQADGISEAPFCLDEIAEFLVNDGEARKYWRVMCQDEMFPHSCPRCGAAAFVGFIQVDCKARCQTGT